VNGSKVARRYARALFELAQGDGKRAETWGVELFGLARTLSAPEILPVLQSPQVSQAVRLAIIDRIAEQIGLGYPLRSFALVITRHGRVGEFEAISHAYQELLDRFLGRVRPTLTFAWEPEQAQMQLLVERLGALVGKTIIPAVKVDRSLLGGVIIELEGKIYDGSLATQLELARNRLVA
jgi:F-type H+-transporting ATPase subunit delta